MDKIKPDLTETTISLLVIGVAEICENFANMRYTC